jgi:hypothetical protein
MDARAKNIAPFDQQIDDLKNAVSAVIDNGSFLAALEMVESVRADILMRAMGHRDLEAWEAHRDVVDRVVAEELIVRSSLRAAEEKRPVEDPNALHFPPPDMWKRMQKWVAAKPRQRRLQTREYYDGIGDAYGNQVHRLFHASWGKDRSISNARGQLQGAFVPTVVWADLLGKKVPGHAVLEGNVTLTALGTNELLLRDRPLTSLLSGPRPVSGYMSPRSDFEVKLELFDGAQKFFTQDANRILRIHVQGWEMIGPEH